MSLINNSAHTLEDVEKLYKELRLTSLYHAISKLNNDQDFQDLTFIEKCYQVGVVCKQKRLENKYECLKRKYNIADTAVLPESNDLAKSNGITIDKLDYIISRITGKENRIVVLTGPTGVGKSTFGMSIMDRALRLGHKALFNDYSLQAYMLNSLYLDRVSYSERIANLTSQTVVMFDDFLLAESFTNEAACIKDILDAAKANRCSVILSSQLPVDKWYDKLLNKDKSNVLLVDAVIDRILEEPIIITLNGDSRRRHKNKTEVINAQIAITNKDESKND